MSIDVESTSILNLMRKGQYFNRNALESVSHLNNPRGRPLISWHILEAMQQQGFAFRPEVDNKSVHSVDDLYLSLVRYGKRTPFEPDGKAFATAINAAFSVFGRKTEALQPLGSDQAIVRALKLDKSSGAPFFDKKANVVDKDLELMRRIRTGKKAPPPCVCAKRVQHGKAGPKTRLVWAYPQSMTMFESIYARPLIEYFMMTQTPMAFGRYRWQLAGELVRIENSDLRVGLDFSGFDSSLHPRMINAAFKILKSHFNEDEVTSSDFEILTRYFIHTSILMPDGFIYQKHKGIPSGSYFTQLVGSICNYISVIYFSQRMNFSVRDRCCKVLGDDSIFGVDQWISMSELSRHAWNDLGMTIHPDKSEVTTYGQDFTFLGHAWDDGIVTRDPLETAKRLAFPESPRPKELTAQEWIVARMFASLADSKDAWLIYKAWDHARTNNIFKKLNRREKVVDDFGWQAHMRETHPDRRDVYPIAGPGYGYSAILR